jgi:hypothetical protein
VHRLRPSKALFYCAQNHAAIALVLYSFTLLTCIFSSLFENADDALWAGCVAVPKAGRLCEHTIQAIPTPEEPACFEVLDLTSDDRFNTLPFVTGAPFFKYYIGVPLRTKRGIPIGSLFALDNKIRDPINKTNKLFLTTMAENVMAHYENQKEKVDRKRVLNMNMCLAAFVDPEHQSRKGKRRTASQASSKPTSSKREIPMSSKKNRKVASDESQPSPDTPGDSDSEPESTSTKRRVEEDDHIQTFKRAADLLHASLSLEGGGGVVFFDTATSYRSVSTFFPLPTTAYCTDYAETPNTQIIRYFE